MLLARFILPLLAVLTVLALIATPLAEDLISRWFQRDVQIRSQLIYQSVEDSLANIWNRENKMAGYARLFENIARNERILAVGLCQANGTLASKSRAWPDEVSCPSDPSAISLYKIDGQKILANSFPLPVDAVDKPHLTILHDLTFSANRITNMRLYLVGFLIIVCLSAAAITLLTARITLREWMSRLRSSLSDPKSSLLQGKLPRELLPVVREMRQMLRDMKPGTYHLEKLRVDWTPQTLKLLLEKELPSSEVIIVSNREPYIHNMVNGKPAMQRPASGVVSALEPITRATGGVWIAHGSGSADKHTVDKDDYVAVPPHKPEYRLKRIWLSPEEEEGYYYGFANEGLWPLCHIAFVRPHFRESDWQTYKAVNRRFAEAVVAEAKTPDPIILVQDYHFALLPRYVRERLPNATVILFWHIPWPNPEVFSICPWREEILSGLLGSSIVGFHTRFHCQNFMDTVDRFLESQINREQSMVTMCQHETHIRSYPISIAWPPEGLEQVPPADECRKKIGEAYNIRPDVRIGVGVERFDYTKGIFDRLQAVRQFLTEYPEWQGRLTFIQAAAPTRSRLPAYQATQQEALKLAEDINKEFGNKNYQPIILLPRHHEPSEVYELFRAADFCIVSSLHDGMNLVAKEFVAARDDEKGVLILSTFAGASKELMEALLVNPYDAKGMADAIHSALNMPENEQKERMHLLRGTVADNNVYYWAGRMLLDAAHLRKRARIAQFISERAQEELPQIDPKHDALFLDIDGTLLDIADTPEKVVIPPTLISHLAKLHDRMGGALALVSGRTIENIDRLFSPLHLPVVGVHGAEWRLSGKARPQSFPDLPEGLVIDAYANLPQHSGILIENKKHSLAVHYRLAPECEGAIEKALRHVLGEYKNAYNLMHGKMVFEIVPAEINKGAAIERFMKHKPFTNRRPVFFGDDETDLFAITACLQLGGFAGRVGPGTPPQETVFSSPAAVRSWLERQAA
jgi:trehalose 6-phosphate synthase/phosphatase